MLTRSEWAILLVTAAYTLGFGAYFVAAGNAEFLWYVATMVALVLLVGFTRKKAGFTTALLWSLSLWGFAHMAGGGIEIDGSVLYALLVIPLHRDGEMSFLKYDQIVHFYGFAVTAIALWQILRHNFPSLVGTKTILVFPLLASMGLGCVNELIEFAAVLSFENTNVGGYTNTALDLFFNGLGAATAVLLIAIRRSSSGSG